MTEKSPEHLATLRRIAYSPPFSDATWIALDALEDYRDADNPNAPTWFKERAGAISENPRYHVLKTWPKYFSDVRYMTAGFDVRRDQDFRVRDLMVLREWLPHTNRYSGAYVLRRITFVRKPHNQDESMILGIRFGYAVLALEPVKGYVEGYCPEHPDAELHHPTASCGDWRLVNFCETKGPSETKGSPS